MDWKTKVIIALSFVLACAVVFLVTWFSRPKISNPEIPTTITSLEVTIDSLRTELTSKDGKILQQQEEITQLQSKLESVNRQKEVEKKIERIKAVPVDKSVEIFKSYLENHKVVSGPEDYLKINMQIQNDLDTIITVSPNIVRDVNIAYAELEGKEDLIKIQEEEIETQEKIIKLQEEQLAISKITIGDRDLEIQKQKIMYQSLEKSLQEQKKQSTKTSLVIGGVAVVSLTATGFLLANVLGK